MLGGLLAAGSANAADRHATTANFASTFSAAQGGDTIYLAAGNYGSFAGAAKASTVTIKPESGAAVQINPRFTSATNLKLDGLTVTGASIAGTSKNITISNSRFTGMTTVGDGSAMSNANIVFDKDTFDAISACSTCYEGRLTVRGTGKAATTPMGVAVTNSHFGNAGESDGVQIIGAATGVKIGPGNVFSGIRQGGYSRHVDSIQLYGSSQTQIVGNYFYGNDTILMAPDGGDRENVSNNVMVGSGDYRPAVQFGHHNGSTFIHNTTKNIDVNTYVVSGDSSPNRNMVSRDNIVINGSLNASGCSACTVSYNLFTSGSTGTNAITGTPVFAGGTAPTTYAGWALKAGSPGKANASDGKDRGINPGTSTPTTPPTTPTTPPPTTPADKPAKAVWTIPSNARVGQAVTLDGTRSTGDGTLTCTWSFENQDASTVWETITGCKLVKTFQNADTKYVRLTVRDADGDTNVSRQAFAVTR
ncbi:PKD domain-containing protein [Baekduia sp. Peel2402]|uniref:PKD domain-containing protein n=1 Tax=Baekduia sp. Peel2402 TaxID=3458296 RepID=UPI00403E76C2